MYISKRLLVLGLVALLGLLLSGPLWADDPELAKKSTLEEILARGKIVVCSDIPFEPFEFEDEQGNLVGFDVDLIKLLAKEMGVGFEFKATAFDTIIPSLNARTCDLIASDITATLQRALSANFSEPYLETGQIALVSLNPPSRKAIQSYSDLNDPGIIITVQLGTTGEEAARKFFPQADIRTFDNAQLALQEVVDGRADAIIFDEVFLRPQSQNPNVQGKAVLCCPRNNPELLTTEFIALAIRKGDPDFLTYLNLFMEQAKKTIKVTAELAQEFQLPAQTIGLPFLQAIRVKWGV